MRRSSELFALAVFLVSAIALPLRAEPTAEDLDKAKLLYNEGLERRDAGDHAAALDLFRAAYGRVASPIIGMDLAREHIFFGQLVQALAIVEAVIKLPVLAEETDKSASARAEASKLALELPKRIPHLRLVVAPGSTVLVDGRLVPGSELGSLALNPGKHEVIVASVTAVKRDVELKEGETRDLSFEPPKAAPPPPVVAPVAPAPSYTLTYVGLGTAGAGVVLGSVTGLLALSYARDVHDRCASNGDCPPDAAGDLRASRTLGTISTISFATAAGGLILGAFGWVHASSRPGAPRVGAVVAPLPNGVAASFVGAF